jgi:hypothetical protein
MVFDFMTEDQILTNCLETISQQTRIIEGLVASQKKLSEALEIATRELKKLKEKSKQDSDRSIS